MITLSDDGPGTLLRYPDFPSQYVQPRHVDIWLPPGYSENAAQRFPVIYMQDGQNLFEPAIAFGGETWDVDGVLCDLMETQAAPGAIIVGIWNSSWRYQEYMPQKPLEPAQAADILQKFCNLHIHPPISDQYLRFIVEEVKPFIDASFRTRPEQANTSIMGSSMGGLISLYALTEYPYCFGGAGCLSTHWPVGEDYLVDVLAQALPPPGAHRLYFDFGTEGLDALYEPYQQRMDSHLQALGYTPEVDWITRKFPGADHTEIAWRARVDIPLRLLLRASA